MKTAEEVARELVDSLRCYSACEPFTPTPVQYAELITAVAEMQIEGCNFTNDEIEGITQGEQTEQEAIYAGYTSWPRLSTVLNLIFDREE